MVSSNVPRLRRVRASFLVVSVAVAASVVQPACGSEDGKKKAGPRYPGSGGDGAAGDAGAPSAGGSSSGTTGVDGGSAGMNPTGGTEAASGSTGVAGSNEPGGAGAGGAAGGSNGPQCEPGTADCDDNPDDCERDVTLPTSCGGCDVTCQSINGSSICGETGCEVTSCLTNFGDCNDTGTDGCETPLDSSAHCGSCDRSCGTAACVSGACASTSLGSSVPAYRWITAGDAVYRLSGNSPNSNLASDYTLTRTPLNGGAEVVMSANNVSPGGLTVDDTYVYWAVQGTPPAVFRKAHTAAAAIAPTPIFEPVSVPLQLRIRNGAMYWVAADGAIYSRSMAAPFEDDGSPIVSAADMKGPSGAFSFHQDFVTTPTALYWVVLPTAGNSALLRTAPLSGAPVTEISGAFMAGYTRLWVVGEDVYWPRATGAATDGVYRYSKGGSVGAPLVVQSGLNSVMADGEFLYLLGSGGVFRAPIAGGSTEKIAPAAPGIFPEFAGADATRFFTVGAFTKGNGFAGGTVITAYPK